LLPIIAHPKGRQEMDVVMVAVEVTVIFVMMGGALYCFRQ
jgi:hypothetical protein